MNTMAINVKGIVAKEDSSFLSSSNACLLASSNLLRGQYLSLHQLSMQLGLDEAA